MEEHHPKFHKLRQELYNREYRVKFRPGTVLVYRHDVWHRGTPVAHDQLRIVVNLAYKRADAEWVTTWNPGWAMYFGKVEKMLSVATPLQRGILGFPMPGHRYWNPVTIKATEARFGPYGFDSTPYWEGLHQMPN